MIPSACHHCGDEKIEVMLSTVSCTTRGCNNYLPDWEERALSSHKGYIVLCFCQDCIHCNGNLDFVGKFRLLNTIYDVYHAYWDEGEGLEDFILLMYGDDAKASVWCGYNYIDSYRDIMSRDFPEILTGYDIFLDELLSKKLTKMNE